MSDEPITETPPAPVEIDRGDVHKWLHRRGLAVGTGSFEEYRRDVQKTFAKQGRKLGISHDEVYNRAYHEYPLLEEYRLSHGHQTVTPPAPEPEPEPPPPAEAEPAEVMIDPNAPDFEFADVDGVDMRESITWVVKSFAVYDDLVTRKQLDRARKMVQSAPNSIAAAYLPWARECRAKFFGDIAPKFLGKEQAEESKIKEDDKRKHLRTLDDIGAYLDDQGDPCPHCKGSGRVQQKAIA